MARAMPVREFTDQLIEGLATDVSAEPVGDVSVLLTGLILTVVSEELAGIDIVMVRGSVSGNLLNSVPKSLPGFVSGNVSASPNGYVIASLLDKVLNLAVGRPSPTREL